MSDNKNLLGLGLWSIAVNVVLMTVKIVVGVLGNSYALVADGIESASDIFSSAVVWAGFRFSLKPPDENHPFGHGKVESLAGAFSGMSLLAAAAFIGYHSVKEIETPHHAPAWFTLPVLIFVVIAKTLLSRKVHAANADIGSQALKGDAWHHMADAFTSGAAAIGITIALIGGPGYEMADDWAALLACVIIVMNGGFILKGSIHDLLDGNVDREVYDAFIGVAGRVEGVCDIEKTRIRKSGVGLFVDMHVRVPAAMSVFDGHEISHHVKDAIQESDSRVRDVIVHIEPFEPQA
jgi:cation diffusion facilitator family transporter